ncbi:MAG: type I-G CRISPR-associated helicase/endonuclease Cas3g [Acidimicrobiales bacterium]
MTGLQASHFAEFQEAVRGRPPFPWQDDLVAEVLGTGTWPDVIDVPTGLGKTTVIDVAMFVAAATGCALGTPGRRRVFFAIDRRIVVDEAYAHADRLRACLLASRGEDTVTGRVAAALDGLHRSHTSSPLCVSRMRGGITWEWRWLDRPDRAAVVVGTVDQLGSRLLFGGYGLNPRLRPIDAALTGVDSLVVVDEAHLATPFVETLKATARTPMVGELALAAPVIVTMSATPPTANDGRRIFPSTFRDAAVSPIAARRVNATKRLHGVLVAKNVDPAIVMADIAASLFAPDDGVAAVGVVCNLVQRARDVAERLRSIADLAPSVHLLTGRIRPRDRDELLASITRDLEAGRDRTAARPAILVATQTIEVGANLDFDALVTESAPIDALVQRLGRLHRLGEPEDAARTCVIVHHDIAQPLYGEARDATWARLVTELGDVPTTSGKRLPALGAGIDASPGAMRALIAASDLLALVVRPLDAPTLMPEILADWASTSNGDAVAARAPFLHGVQEADDDLSLVWRADLDQDDSKGWQSLVDRLPPTAAEQLDVPIRAAARWLRTEPAADVADIPGGGAPAEPADHPGWRADVFVWRGRGDGEVLVSPSDLRRLRPGDVLVLPATAGGCDSEGWFPTSGRTVPDLADVEGRSVRLDPRTLPRRVGIDPALVTPHLAAMRDALRDGDEADDAEIVADALAAIADELGDGDDRARARLAEVSSGTVEVLRAADGQIIGVYVDLPLGDDDRREMLGDGSLAEHDPTQSSAAGAQVPLEVHHRAVAERARTIAEALRLPERVVESVVLAASAHDLGKWDPRFQIMLHGGDVAASRAAVVRGAPLAKSGMRADDRTAARVAQRASGLPRGYRHEAGSAQAVAAQLDGRDVDPDLVRHLVAAHHGNSRPLLPAVLDEGSTFDAGGTSVDPRSSVDFDHPRRFRALSERYGHWGLAMLETIVRLSDIGCSEEGS